jgi:hypothetical protein
MVQKKMISMKVDTNLLNVLDTNLEKKDKSRTAWFEDGIVKEFGNEPGKDRLRRRHHVTRGDNWKARFMANVQPGVNMLYEVLERMGADEWQPKMTCRKQLLADLILEGQLEPFTFNGRYTTIEKARGKK